MLCNRADSEQWKLPSNQAHIIVVEYKYYRTNIRFCWASCDADLLPIIVNLWNVYIQIVHDCLPSKGLNILTVDKSILAGNMLMDIDRVALFHSGSYDTEQVNDLLLQTHEMQFHCACRRHEHQRRNNCH